MKIPKIAHLSWVSKEIVNSNNLIIQNGLKNLIKLNPDWEINIHTDEEVDYYVKEHLKAEDYQLYNNTHIVEKLDIWRLIKLYYEGGLYMDLDRLYNIPLNDIIDDDTFCVLPTCQNHDFSQDFMLSAPGNSIYKNVFNLILERRRDGAKHIYYLGPQTYMHGVTLTLMGKLIDTNPGEKVFNEIRQEINNTGNAKTYKESTPWDTIVFRNKDNLDFDHEQEKRNLYKEFNLKHWANWGL